MSEQWRSLRLGEVVRQRRTRTKVQEGIQYPLLGVRWYGQGPFLREVVTTETSKAATLFEVRPGDFIYNRLFAWKGSFGLIGEELSGSFVSGEFPLFEVDERQIDGTFLNLVMCRPIVWEQIEIESTGSTKTSRNRWKEEAFTSFMIRLPPLAEQRRIVDLIGSIDAYIDALEAQIEATRTTRMGVLSELLSNPGEDWQSTTLGEITVLEYGKALKEADRDGSGFPVFGSAGEVGRHSVPLVTEGPVIVVGRKGTAGSVHWSPEPCSVIDTAYWVRIKAEHLEPEFAYLAISSLNLPSLSAQTGVPGLNRERAYSKPVDVPPPAERRRIVDLIGAIDEQIEGLESQVAAARDLRSGVLSELMSGERLLTDDYEVAVGL